MLVWSWSLSHLADDVHVSTANDALLHLGTKGSADLHFVSVQVGRVNVAVTRGNGCLYSSLEHYRTAGLEPTVVADRAG